MNISLPQSLEAFVEKQVARGGYGSMSEYVRELIRRERNRAQIRGLLSGGSEPPLNGVADDEYFEGLRAH